MIDHCFSGNRRWQRTAAPFLLLACFAFPTNAQMSTGLAFGAPVPLEERIGEARDDYQYLFDQAEFEEAAASAKLLISLLLQDPDHDRLVYADALTGLALAQQNAEQYEAAIENYELAIEVVTAERDRLAAELVAPMLGLSRTYKASGQYLEAIRGYKQTLHIHQVNSGLYGDEKGLITAELSEAYFELGDFKRARDMQDSYVSIVARDHPGDDLDRLPSLYSRADMLIRTGNAYRSMEAYRRIIAMIEHVEGTKSLKLIPAFVKISHLLADYEIVDGDDGIEKARRYMRRAVDIIEKSDEADTELKATVYVMMGDFLSLQSANRRLMVRNYQRGWNEFSKDERLTAQRDTVFGAPTLLNQVPVKTAPRMRELLEKEDDPSIEKNGVVIVRYDVTEYGRVDNVRVVESYPPDLYNYMAKNHVRNFAFRPHFVDGEPVTSPDRLFELRFAYNEEELPEKVRQNMESYAVSDAGQ